VAGIALAGVIVAVVAAFSATGRWFGFVGLPPAYFAFLAMAVLLFLGVIEVAKQGFYRWISRRDLTGGARRAGRRGAAMPL